MCSCCWIVFNSTINSLVSSTLRDWLLSLHHSLSCSKSHNCSTTDKFENVMRTKHTQGVLVFSVVVRGVVLLILMDWGLRVRKSMIQLQRELVNPSRLSFAVGWLGWLCWKGTKKQTNKKNHLSQLVIVKALHYLNDGPLLNMAVYTSLISHYRVIAETCPSSSWCINTLKWENE